jgi:hypothetical protein
MRSEHGQWNSPQGRFEASRKAGQGSVAVAPPAVGAQHTTPSNSAPHQGGSETEHADTVLHKVKKVTLSL